MITRRERMNIGSLKTQGYSQRQISDLTGLHRQTIKKYLEEEALPIYKKVKRESKLVPYQGMINDWLEQQDYRATRIYDLVKAEGYEGSYYPIRRYVRIVKQKRDRTAYIRFETLPGRQAQVDFGDFVVDNPDGTTTIVPCFIMLLGYSRHKYVEFVERCTMPVFLECHQNAFGFFGGVPAEILYDNLKNVVIKRLAGAVEWNKTFAEFCAHYGFKPLAAPPYAPWVKGKVERPIDYVRERFWRGYRFQGRDKANADVKEWVLTTAFHRIHGTTREKVADRFEREKPQLGSLPRRPYDTSEKVWRKVYKDCRISFDGNWYVVAHECVGKKLLLKVKDGQVRIFDDDQLVVLYQIPPGKGNVVADPRFYERLKADKQQQERKYHSVAFGKGKATRGLVSDGLDYEVMKRSLTVYDRIIPGEAPSCPN